MEQKEKMSLVEYRDIYGKICENTDLISAELFDEYGVKRDFGIKTETVFVRIDTYFKDSVI